MRIGNIIDTNKADKAVNVAQSTNYSKAELKKQVKLDITGTGKDTDFLVDQGRSMQDVINVAGALDVQTAQDYMTVMSNTMSEEDYKKLDEGGFDPADLSGEQSATILDHIKAVMAESGQIVEGYNDSQDIETLIGITGSVADANALMRAMREADIAQSEENAENIFDAAGRIADIDSLNDGVIRYMIENKMPATMENVYKACFSAGASHAPAGGYYALDMSGYLGKKADVSGEDLMEDIKSAVARFTITDIDISEQIDNASWLIENDLNVTAENIIQLHDLKNIELPIDRENAFRRAAVAIKEGKEAQEAILNRDYEDIYTKAAGILEKTKQLSPVAVENVANSGKELNLRNLWEANRYIQTAESVSVTADTYTQGKAALEEVRLKMTLDVNVALLKRGMEIDTMPLTKLVEDLKQEENRLRGMFLGEGDEQQLEIKASVYKQTRQVVSDIPYLPAAVIGRLKLQEDYSLTKVHEAGTELKAKYEAAGQSYETLMTAPRKDMGDTIAKAFRNVDDILADLSMEAVEENRKAVRILGYNSMDINKENIDRIKEELNRVLKVTSGLTPSKTLELIRRNINPLDMKLEELSAVLDTLQSDDNDEKYSSFLYRLEKDNAISQEERKSYIGIYRLMNRLEKTDEASIGAMVAQNRDITFRSLLSGMRSSRVNLDLKIDENFGFLSNVVQKGISITDQIDSAYRLDVGEDRYAAGQREYREENYREYMDLLKQQSEQPVEDYEPVTLSEAVAYSELNSAGTNVYRRLLEFADKYSDTEYEAKLTEEFENIAEAFEDRITAGNAMRKLQQTAEEYTVNIREYKADSYIDLKEVSLCHKQLSVAGKLSDSEKYLVPMYADGELTAVNLTFKHGKEAGGRIDIAYEAAYGHVNAHLQLTGDKATGLIVCETAEGFNRMTSAVDLMKTTNSVTVDINVVIGKENQAVSRNDFSANTDINNVDTKSLYRFAKSFLKAGFKA